MIATLKHCTRCSTDRDVTEFALDVNAKDGRSGWCKPCRREWARDHRARNPRKTYDVKLLARYGITADQYDELAKAQGHRCAICGCPDPRAAGTGPRRLHVDHDHVTGKVRGLLCGPCNSGLGHFADDLARLRAAVTYMEATS